MIKPVDGWMEEHFIMGYSNDFLNQGNLIQGKARLALKNWKNLFEDHREDSVTSLKVCYLL